MVRVVLGSGRSWVFIEVDLGFYFNFIVRVEFDFSFVVLENR